jgi:hypothetical protein
MLEPEKNDGHEVRIAANSETSREPVMEKPPC